MGEVYKVKCRERGKIRPYQPWSGSFENASIKDVVDFMDLQWRQKIKYGNLEFAIFRQKKIGKNKYEWRYLQELGL